MGAGKTSAGHLIDQKLQDFTYIDIDREIEKQTEKYIMQIFAEDGEAYFRKIENEVVKKYSVYSNQVIATGGGVVENMQNIELLRQNGVLFYLSASSKTLYDRVKTTKNRPLLFGDNPQDKIKELLKRREKFYKMADFEINTDNKDLLGIVKEIMEKYETA